MKKINNITNDVSINEWNEYINGDFNDYYKWLKDHKRMNALMV